MLMVTVHGCEDTGLAVRLKLGFKGWLHSKAAHDLDRGAHRENREDRKEKVPPDK